MEDVGFLERVLPLTFTLLFVNLQSPPSNVAVVVVLHHHTVQHDAGVQPPSQRGALFNHSWITNEIAYNFLINCVALDGQQSLLDCNFEVFRAKKSQKQTHPSNHLLEG